MTSAWALVALAALGGAAAVALVALAGWTAVLVLLSRSLLPMANALGVLHKVDSVVDDRIQRVVERIEGRRNRGVPVVPPPQPKPQSNQAASQLAEIFGGSPIEGIGEQPESDGERLEVVS